MDDVEMIASMMVELADVIYRPIVEEKYGEFLDGLKDAYMKLGAQALALGEEKQFKQALTDLLDFAERQSRDFLRPE